MVKLDPQVSSCVFFLFLVFLHCGELCFLSPVCGLKAKVSVVEVPEGKEQPQQGSLSLGHDRLFIQGGGRLLRRGGGGLQLPSFQARSSV